MMIYYILLSIVCVACLFAYFKYSIKYRKLKEDINADLSFKVLFFAWLFLVIFVTSIFLMMDISNYHSTESYLFFPDGKILTGSRVVRYLLVPAITGLVLVCEFLIAKRKKRIKRQQQ